MSELDPNYSLKKKSSKLPMYIVLGLLIFVGAGFVHRTILDQRERKAQAEVMESFRGIENGDVAKFWACALTANVEPASILSNEILSQRIEAAFNTDPKSYPQKISTQCVPELTAAKAKVDGMSAPGYAEALLAYGKSLAALGAAFDAWARVAPAQVQKREMSQKLADDADAFHAYATGTPSPQVIAYDQFLHCAIPAVDTLKDGQAVVEYLFEQCKNPAYDRRIDDECGKNILQPPTAPTPGFKIALKKTDGREKDGFADCLRKNRKAQRSGDLGGVGRAWKDYMDAGAAVRQIGKAALK